MIIDVIKLKGQNGKPLYVAYLGEFESVLPSLATVENSIEPESPVLEDTSIKGLLAQLVKVIRGELELKYL
jgi:hypothetical protein